MASFQRQTTPSLGDCIFNHCSLRGQQVALQSLPLKALNNCGLHEWSSVYQKVQQFVKDFS